MDLLEDPLPELSLRPRVGASLFFDNREELARRRGYGVDRRKQFAGEGCDQLNLYVGGEPDVLPMIRMILVPSSRGRVRVDVVMEFNDSPPRYEEYIRVAKEVCHRLLREYADQFGESIRLGIPKRKPYFDPRSADLSHVPYALEKFQEAVYAMAVGPGDVRKRLGTAYLIFHTVRASDLPEPLNRHLQWVEDELTKRPARFDREGRVQATLARMRRRTGVKIAERILAIYKALEELNRTYLRGT